MTVVLFIGLLLAGWAWIESDAAAVRMRGWIETRASAALNRAVSIGALEIDLVPFRVQANDVRVAGDESEDTPFFEVETVRLSMRFGALLARELIVSSLELTRPTLHLDLRPDGSSNAPALPTAGAVGAGFSYVSTASVSTAAAWRSTTAPPKSTLVSPSSTSKCAAQD